jgi:iron(III) transport system ATP-binding protein
MLFDEPLSNLDARLRRSMREEIRTLQQRLGLTVAYVTHDQSEALAVSDQIIVMDAGRIAQAGTPQQLYDHPQTAFVAGFMGEAMLFDAVAQADGAVRLGPLVVQADRSVRAGAVKVAVRPEAWQVGTPGVGWLDGVIAKSCYLGRERELTVATALGEVFLMTQAGDAPWAVGASVGLRLRSAGVSVVNAPSLQQGLML